jgi:hypothetical protein
LKPNEFTWVNDETKQFYFYLNEISDKLAKTKENDGVEFTLIKEPFIYDKTNKKHEKCEDVEYLYLWEGEVKPQKIKSIPIITNGYAINKYAGQIGEIEDSKSWQMQILRDGSDKDKTKLSRDVFESNNDTLIEINKTNNTLIFTNGLFKNFQKDNFEYLRLLDISVKYGIQNKTFKIGIAHSSWGDFQDKVENVENDDDDDPGPVPVTDDDCFPGNSQLILKDGTKKLFHDIEVGDEIQVCSKDMELSYSKVIFLPHLQNNKSTEYIKFTTTSNQTIRATALHLLPVLDKNNTLQNVIAKNITQEDKLYVLNNGKGVPEEIKTIEIIEEKGVYTCLVKEGEYIVVDNIVASPFPGDGLDESYVSKYAFSYTMLRLYAKGFSMLDSMGVLNFTAPLLRSMVFAVANNCHF